MDIDQIDLDAARERLGATFELRSADGAPAVTVELTEVEPASAAGSASGFSLLFRGPVDPVLNQSIRELRDERWGSTELFLVPVGRDAGGTYYEAIINRP